MDEEGDDWVEEPWEVLDSEDSGEVTGDSRWRGVLEGLYSLCAAWVWICRRLEAPMMIKGGVSDVRVEICPCGRSDFK